MPKRYVPRQGDIVWLDFVPQAGHEQAGRRPALVLSPEAYNAKVGLMLCAPVTNQVKGYPFEVQISAGRKVSGVVLSDQIKSLDWQARRAEFITRAKQESVAEAVGKIKALIEVV